METKVKITIIAESDQLGGDKRVHIFFASPSTFDFLVETANVAEEMEAE